MNDFFPNQLEMKFARFDADALKVTDDHVIAGYASLFGECDQGGDVVEQGAYGGSLKRLAGTGRRVRMLWQHDPTEPIGIWDEVREDDRGLFVKGRLLMEVARAREAAALIAAGAIDGLSIGYRTLRATKDGQGRRLLSEVELWEVSLVTFPMLPKARVGPAVSAREAKAEGDLIDLARAFEDARAKLAVREPRRPQPSKTEVMEMTETRSGAADDTRAAPSAIVEVKDAMRGFLSEFNQFQDDMKAKFHKQEERIAMLNTKMTTHSRPALSAQIDQAAPHKKALASYLRNGDDDALRGLEIERKGMSTAVNAEGGYLVDPQTAETIQSVLRASASLRAVANIVQVEASSFDVLIDTTDTGAGWADEVTDTAETGTPQIERISIALHELSAMPKASQRLLDDTAFDVEGWLAGRIADKFARAEADAFINGDGAGRPSGLLNGFVMPNDSWSWGTLGYVVTGTAGDFDAANPADAIVDLVYALGAQYRANATFVMNSKTAGAVRKMKDADGRFLWADGLAAGEPARLMGYPVLIAEDMPDIAVDSTAIAFGDFRAGYTIAERPELRVLRDPFSAKPHVLFYATKRVGGAVSDFAAIKLMKFGQA